MTKEELISAYHLPQLVSFIHLKPNGHVALQGLCGSGISLTAVATYLATQRPALIVVNDKEEAAYLYNDLEALLAKDNVFFFPSSSRLPYQLEKTDNANVLHRAELLNALSNKAKCVVVVSYPEALSEKVATRQQLQENTFEIERGNQLSIDFLNELMFSYHFQRVDFVTQPGEFSIRGGIVDVYSYAGEHPFRIELMGNEVDSVRTFDPASQLTIEHIGKVRIVPNIQNKEIMSAYENFIEFLPENTMLYVKDVELLKTRANEELQKAEKYYNALSQNMHHVPPDKMFSGADEMEKLLATRFTLEFGVQHQQDAQLTLSFNQQPQPSFNKNFELLSKHFHENAKQNIENLVVSSSKKQIERLHSIFEDLEKEKHFTPLELNLHEGFIDKDRKIACYTDHQIFERYHRFRLKEGFAEAQQRITLKELNQLQKGDYVTHVDHGVGQFAGLVKIENNGQMQEAIKLIYKDNDILYVSIQSLHRISKFSGKEGSVPKINKLGTQAWKNLKNKTKKRIKEIAFDLIKLYAERKACRGFAFSPDNYLQNELEASFIYEDTPDQEKTTLDVKRDMESESPMDRLVCGDVGFGKTEVAMRAAFKAALDGKQVAVLVPTTILALQHYRSFKERFADFPVTVDYVNRFKSSAKVKETLKNLSEGKVDIIVGTHRLVGKDVKFKDLGLLVIDEEQKFGVSVKDKLKTFKANVDTLTLTATPIPRTLQFSLMGARDLSVISTPPPNRQPVQTEIHSMNEEVLRDAIRYELARDGQVFIVSNRVQNIQEVAGMVQRLVPDAKIITAHGQLDGKDLENRMMQFIEGEADVLIATTIIESGLDIPNANTIIILNAHQFGLSDLHQMRGRVGRSNKKAFCYLIAPPLSTLPPDGRKRLTAISQFSDLGSGINIAMRDLDIRGAGDLLGGEQSGFISEIGFDMYQKILNEAIAELKENEFKDVFEDYIRDFVEDTQIETDLEIMIPDHYVNNVTERLRLYQELADIHTEFILNEFKKKVSDRFGPLPEEVERLIESIKIKWLGKTIGLEKVVLKTNKLICYFPADQSSAYFQSDAFSRVLGYMKENPRGCELKERNNKLTLVFNGVNTIEQSIELLDAVSRAAVLELS